MALDTLNQVIAARSAGAFIVSVASKQPASIGTANFRRRSLFAAAGVPAAGVDPATLNGATTSRSTVGALPFSNAAGGKVSRVARATGLLFAGATALTGRLLLYDRLWANGGRSGTDAALQAISQPALTRYASGAGVELLGEVYTSIGATTQTVTVSYTNQDGTAGRSGTMSTPGNATNGGQVFGPLTLQAGDTGVRSVQSMQLGATTGVAGSYGLTLARRLAAIPVRDGQFDARFTELLQEVLNDACMWVVAEVASSAALDASLDLEIIQA